MNTHVESMDDDDDELGRQESRPLLVWFLMAVALVAMAFLLGSAPQVVAHAELPDAGAAGALYAVSAPAEMPDLAFGG